MYVAEHVVETHAPVQIICCINSFIGLVKFNRHNSFVITNEYCSML